MEILRYNIKRSNKYKIFDKKCFRNLKKPNNNNLTLYGDKFINQKHLK